jgi:hypothetical protein
MPPAFIFSKAQSRQRVDEVKAAVALSRKLNEIVGSNGENVGPIQFNIRSTKNL